MRRHLTYANVAATLALVFAMTGGAIAANHYLINSTKQINPRVLKKLRGSTGKTGAIGKTGATGPQGKEGPSGKDAAIAPLAWTPMALENGWVAFTEYGTPSYAKDAEGFVHLGGSLDGEKMKGAQIALLPPGFRPTRSMAVWLRAAGTNGEGEPQLVDIEIDNGGEVRAEPSKGANEKFVGLEGLTFYAG
jgi:hypothetical protein